MSIDDNIRTVKERIAAAATRAGRDPDGVILVAISKGHDASVILDAFEAGQRLFGENRVQEAAGKLPAIADLRSEISLHMVGHLQTNKVKNSLQTFDIIQSVDSVHLGEAIDRRAGSPVPVFLEVNASGEGRKGGLRPEELAEALRSLRHCEKLDIRGLMTMAPNVDPEETRPVFRRLRELAEALGLPELSMGMTNDFEVAVEEGATLVRVGTAIFGARGHGIKA